MTNEDLIAEAKKRGFVHGVTVRVTDVGMPYTDILKNENYWFDANGRLWGMGGTYSCLLYEKGKWAEIISQETYTPQELKDQKIAVHCTSPEQARKLAKRWNPNYSHWDTNSFYSSKDFEVAWVDNQPSWQNKVDGRSYPNYFVEEHNFTKTIEFSQVNFQEMEKKITGYKFKADCEKYRKAAEQIAGFTQGSVPLEHFLSGNGEFKAALVSAGVLDLWFEPVYGEEEIRIGEYKVDIISEGGYRVICVHNARYPQAALKAVREVLQLKYVNSINAGCNGEIKIDLPLIEKILNRLK